MISIVNINFRCEISTHGEDFRDAVGYFSVDDLQNALDHLNAMKDILMPLGLLDVDIKQSGLE